MFSTHSIAHGLIKSVVRPFSILLSISFALGIPMEHTVGKENAKAVAKTTLLEVVDQDGNVPSDPNSVLYEVHSGNLEPLIVPDGHQLTLGEFSNVSGQVHAKCKADGTRVSLNLSGLIPNGVYTVWSDLYAAPGFTPDFAHEIGLGALGPNDGSQSAFVASSDGKARLETTVPAGPLSWFGDAPTCLLEDPVEDYVLWGVYHIDGQTYGELPGPAGTWASHFNAFLEKPGMRVGHQAAVPEPSGFTLAAITMFASFITIRRRRH